MAPEHRNLERATILLDAFMSERDPAKYTEYLQMQASQALNTWLWRGATCGQAARLVEASLLEGNPLT